LAVDAGGRVGIARTDNLAGPSGLLRVFGGCA